MEFEYRKKQIIFSHLEYLQFRKRKLFFAKKLLSTVLAKRRLQGNVCECTFFCSTRRTDQLNFFDAIYQTCKRQKSKMSIKRSTTVNVSKIFNFIIKLGYLNNISKVLEETYGEKANTKQLIYIYCDYIEQLDFLKGLKKTNLDELRCLIVLADALLYEQTFILYAKSKNMCTVSAQHALFFEQEKFDNLQKLNYYHAPSEYILIWGENTNKLFQKYSEGAKTIICGHPLITKKAHGLSNYIAVAGDSTIYLEQNKTMIKIAEEYAKKHGLILRIRLHPVDIPENYSVDRNITRFDKDISNARFVITHASSMICQLMTEGMPVFRFKSDVVLDYVPKQIEFQDERELENLLKNIGAINFEAISKKNIAYYGVDSQIQYTKAFDKIRGQNESD